MAPFLLLFICHTRGNFAQDYQKIKKKQFKCIFIFYFFIDSSELYIFLYLVNEKLMYFSESMMRKLLASEGILFRETGVQSGINNYLTKLWAALVHYLPICTLFDNLISQVVIESLWCIPQCLTHYCKKHRILRTSEASDYQKTM